MTDQRKGSLTVSSNQLMNLFASEMQTIQDTINTNLAVLAQINESQPDYLAYLTNQAAMDANEQLQAEVQQGQPARLASASAAVLVQSKLLSVNEQSAQMESAASSGVELGVGIGEMCAGDPAGIESAMSGGLDVFNMFSGGQSAQDVMENQIQNIQTSINDLSHNVNYRFDRLDQSLTTIFDTMNQQFSQIDTTLGILNGNVNDIRRSLVTVQSSLDRIEAEDFAKFSAGQRDQIVGPIDNDLLYAVQYPPTRGPFPEVGFGSSGGGYEADEGLFFKYALNDADNAISSPSGFTDFSGSGILNQLTTVSTNTLDDSLNFIYEYLNGQFGPSVSTAGTEPLANPQEWFIAAYAYLQLAGENPIYFRKDASRVRVSKIISQGQNIANFCSSLTLNPGTTNINWTLWNALENNYIDDLTNFNSQISETETAYANANGFNLGAWRQWDAAAPRVAGPATALYPPMPAGLPIYAKAISAGFWHSLALLRDGSIVGWGDNNSGQSNIPADATNIVAISDGFGFSLALRADGSVVAWGEGAGGLTNVPPNATNVVAISAGLGFSLALKADGTIVGWGDNSGGELNIPADATNVVKISSEWYDSLALRADGTVVAWGANEYGQSTVPASLTNVVAVAAGGDYDLALRTNGTVVAWGDDTSGQTNVPPSATNIVAIAAGLALRADGTIIAWGDDTYGQTNVPSIPAYSDGAAKKVVAIAADGAHSLALLDDGTIISWGENNYGQTNTPTVPSPDPSEIVALAQSDNFSLAVLTNRTVVAWGDNDHGQLDVPADATNVVAVACGVFHSLALRADGTVVAWGAGLTNDPSNVYDYGQSIVPAGLGNVVAIAGGYGHSVALRSDGTVVAWGDNSSGQINVPPIANNVVEVVAGEAYNLALRADGTVVGWGQDQYGQATGVSNTVSPNISSGVVTVSGQTLSNIVAIASGGEDSLALRTDGTVIAWGANYNGQIEVPPDLTNVVAIAASDNYSLALRADGSVTSWPPWIEQFPTNVVAMAAGGANKFLFLTSTNNSAISSSQLFVRAELPERLGTLFQSCNQNTIHELGLTGSGLDNAAVELSGSKALLSAVLQLGMPYTLAHDGILHGFLYGSDSLMDNDGATTFLQNQNEQLQASPNAAPQALTEVAALGSLGFQTRLNQDLTNLQATGQPEIPRLVGQTLRLLNLLSDAWTAPTNSPPPALELTSQSNAPSLLLYGEPYMNYTLQYEDSLGASGWTTTTLTNLQDGQTIIPPFSGSPQRFYRTLLPTP